LVRRAWVVVLDLPAWVAGLGLLAWAALRVVLVQVAAAAIPGRREEQVVLLDPVAAGAAIPVHRPVQGEVELRLRQALVVVRAAARDQALASALAPVLASTPAVQAGSAGSAALGASAGSAAPMADRVPVDTADPTTPHRPTRTAIGSSPSSRLTTLRLATTPIGSATALLTTRCR
jgi:hypothetical protein